MRICDRIVSLRKMANISQKELAKMLNLSTTSMNRIELGDRPLKDEEVARISDIFDISADFLLGRASPKGATQKEKSKELRSFMAIARDSKPKHIEIATNLLRQLKEDDTKKGPSKRKAKK